MRPALLALLALLTPAAAADITVSYTDKAKLTFTGDWNTWHDHVYTTRHHGGKTCNGTVTARPGAPAGRYEVFVTFRATENRGPRGAKYFVDGRFAKQVRQRSDQNAGQTYPKVSLGVFDLTPASTLMMKADDGTSYSFRSFILSPTDRPAGTASGGGRTDLDNLFIPGGGGTAGGDFSLRGPGEKTFVAPADGAVRVTAKLATYGEAALAVAVTSGGREDVWLTWRRANDVDGSPLMVDGRPDAESMFERKPGDMSARARTHERKVKKGDRVKLTLKGDFGAGEPELSLAFVK